ncbi:MAG: hypothetical protein EOM10_14575, partial [Opitutae bacterium]|nr:hypothetical protein [Opitutae bacterium]
MRLKSTLFALFVVALLVATGGPALAQGGNPVVTDEGNNIYLVDGNNGPIPNLLPADEVAKIARLQSETGAPSQDIRSPISPDDKTVFLYRLGRGAFITLADGTSVPWTVPGDFVDYLTNFFWLDANTLGWYGLSSSTPQPTLFTWDRRTGEGRAAGTLALANQVPVFVSADGRKVLLASVPPVDPSNPGAALAVADSDSGAGRPALMTRAQTSPRARALRDFAALFDPLIGGGRKALTVGTALSVLDTATGERREVVQLNPNEDVSEVSFSQNGSQFALTLNV